MRPYRNKQSDTIWQLLSLYGRIRSHHMLGAGALATVLGVYHFASENGLLGILQSPRVSSAIQSIEKQLTPNSNSANRFDTGSTQDIPTGRFTATSNGASPYIPNGGNTVPAPPNSFPAGGEIQVYFSPGGGCTEAVVREIQNSRQQVLIQAYSFTSEPIAKACVDARMRGVNVFAVLDRSQETEQYSAADFLLNSGIPTLIDSKHQIAHNKVILIDGQTVITGSFNFTQSAERDDI